MNVFKSKLTVREHPAADVGSASSNDRNRNRRVIQFFLLQGLLRQQEKPRGSGKATPNQRAMCSGLQTRTIGRYM